MKIRYIYYIIYLPVLSLALILLFASSFYILYFTNLLLILYSLYKSENIMTLRELFIFINYMIFLSLVYKYFEELRYKFYLDINIVDTIYYIDLTTIYLLTSLHIIILFFMGYNREKLYRI